MRTRQFFTTLILALAGFVSHAQVGLGSFDDLRGKRSFVPPIYADTTAANAGGAARPLAQITTYTGGTNFWIRNKANNTWQNISDIVGAASTITGIQDALDHNNVLSPSGIDWIDASGKDFTWDQLRTMRFANGSGDYFHSGQGGTLISNYAGVNNLHGSWLGDNSAVLTISSPDKGLLIPRLDETARDGISSPATSLLIFNSTSQQFEFYNGSAWVALNSGGGGGGAWGSITGTLSDQTDLQAALDVKESVANKATDFSTLNHTLYPTTQAIATYLAAQGYLTSISGIAAGGDLTGTYPNPTIATNAVSNAKLAQMAGLSVKGNNSGSTANAGDLTMAQLKTMLSYTTTDISEGTNLYYTDARARAAISLTTTGSSGPATYDNGTGVLNIPQYSGGGGGGVTSVGLTMPGVLFNSTVPGSPITSTGTFTPTLVDATAWYLLGRHSGSSGAVSYGHLKAEHFNTSYTNGQVATTDGSGNLSFSDKFTGSYFRWIEVTRTVPTTVGNEVDIGSFVITNGAAAFDVFINIPSMGYSTSKRYFFTTLFNQTSGVWQRVLPISSTGGYSSNDAELDISISSGNVFFRIRRTSGTTAAIANISIFHHGVVTDVFTPSTSTSSVSVPTTNFNSALLHQVGGSLGIGTNTPLAKVQIGRDLSVGSPTSGMPLLIATNTNNGGSSLSAEEEALSLVREGVGGQAYANTASFWLKRYENSGTSARSQLTIKLNHGSNTTTDVMTLRSNGNVGISATVPTALMHLGAGTATASTAPLKFTAGTKLTTPEPGAIEYVTGSFVIQNDGLTIGSTAKDGSAIIDIQGSNKGVLLPRMSSTARGTIVSPATGLIVFDTDINALYWFNGSIWRRLGARPYTPSGTADSAGNVGDEAYDDNYHYIKTSAGWKRTALSTF